MKPVIKKQNHSCQAHLRVVSERISYCRKCGKIYIKKSAEAEVKSNGEE